VTGAELKHQILTAVGDHGDVVNISNMKLITSGRVINDDVVLLQQPQIRVCYSCYLIQYIRAMKLDSIITGHGYGTSVKI